MPEFETRLARLKEALGVATAKEVANILEMSDKALNARKRRLSFPEKELYALAAKRPDLNLDVNYVLTGKTQRERAVEAAASVATYSAEAMRKLQQDDRRVAEPAAFPLLSEREAALLANYRACTNDGRAALDLTALTLATGVTKA